MASGIIICKANGGANAAGIAASQTIAAGGGTFVLNGSLVTGGVAVVGTNLGRKVTVFGPGTLTSSMVVTLTGEFFGSASTGATTNTMAISGDDSTSTATGALYAISVSSAVASTITTGLYTIGVTSDAQGKPIVLSGANTYQVVYGGTFGGATEQVQAYDADLEEWSALDAGTATAGRINYELPQSILVRGIQTSGSTTTAMGIVAHPITKR